METQVLNVQKSQSDFCDAFESISNDINAANPYHCCVNSSNGKMRCDRKTTLDTFAFAKWYSYSETGVCDRCSTGTSGEPTSCDNYATDFPDNLCK